MPITLVSLPPGTQWVNGKWEHALKPSRTSSGLQISMHNSDAGSDEGPTAARQGAGQNRDASSVNAKDTSRQGTGRDPKQQGQTRKETLKQESQANTKHRDAARNLLNQGNGGRKASYLSLPRVRKYVVQWTPPASHETRRKGRAFSSRHHSPVGSFVPVRYEDKKGRQFNHGPNNRAQWRGDEHHLGGRIPRRC